MLTVKIGRHPGPAVDPVQTIPLGQQHVYTENNIPHDLLLIQLNSEVPTYPTIQLPPSGSCKVTAAGTTVKVGGWAATTYDQTTRKQGNRPAWQAPLTTYWSTNCINVWCRTDVIIFIFEPTGHDTPVHLQCADTKIEDCKEALWSILSEGPHKLNKLKNKFLCTTTGPVQQCCVSHFDISSWKLLLLECTVSLKGGRDVSERQGASSLPPDMSNFKPVNRNTVFFLSIYCCIIISFLYACYMHILVHSYLLLIGRLRRRSWVRWEAVWSSVLWLSRIYL